MEVNGQDQPPEGSTPKGLASSDDAWLEWFQCLQCPFKCRDMDDFDIHWRSCVGDILTTIEDNPGNEITNTGNEILQCHNMDDFEPHLNTECVNFKGETPNGDASPVVPEEREEGAATSAAVGSHWKELDPKGMKVVELRSLLKTKGLSTKGVKTILAERLQKSLDEEKQKESEIPTTPKKVSCGNKRKLFSPKKILFSPNGLSDYLMPLVKSPVRKGRRSDPSPIKFDEAEGSEEADRAEIADSVANILNTLEDNPGDELTDTGNEISQATAEFKPSQREFKSGPAAKKKKVQEEEEGQGEPEANGKEDTKDKEVAQPKNWWKKTQHLHIQWLMNHDWGLTDIDQRGYYQPPPPPKKLQSSAKGKYFPGPLEDYRQLAVAAYRREESLRRRNGHFMELRKDRT